VPTLNIAANASLALARAYDEAYPHEACGFLLGRAQDDVMIATEIAVARDSAAYRDSFEIADPEVERVVAHAEDLKLQIVALFHSHPSGSGDLSQSDRAALRYSAWPWLVVTRPGGTSAIEMACYAYGDAQRIAVIADFGVPER